MKYGVLAGTTVCSVRGWPERGCSVTPFPVDTNVRHMCGIEPGPSQLLGHLKCWISPLVYAIM